MELGRFGIFGRASLLTPERVRRLEQLGFGAVWLGGSPPAELSDVEAMLDGSDHIVAATGIVNIWRADAAAVAASYHRIEASHPGRFLLGIGAGHPESTAEYRTPYQAVVDYLDVLDAEGVPRERRVLAALGPRMLRLSADRSAGAHPYLTTLEATRRERATLGPDALLAPEQRVVLVADPVAARAIGRPSVAQPYLGLTNYTSNLRRLGYDDADVAAPGSDRLIDDLVVYGDGPTIAARMGEHLAAGADHLAVQLIAEPGADLDASFAELAALLLD
jgi:probable F420-dependent oxidoreductase